ncbi:MAG: DUF2784 domain-containing protein [Bacteroidota bacterium]|nr:DUF2784 domain-containing protein [Bacteroidota bacterium]
MFYKALADLTIIFHISFIAFVALGGLLVTKHPHAVYFHIPAMTWGALVEFYNIPCPLTGIENYLRMLSGEQGYESGFIQHYLLKLVYPGFTVNTEFLMGCLVIIVNAIIYSFVLHYKRKNQRMRK